MGDESARFEPRDPWNDAVGLRIESASTERVTASVVIDPARHMQAMGLVHGGVFASIAESLASLGCALNVIPDGKSAAGMENHTSFIRSITTAQRVDAVAEPVHRGRTTHAWEVRITDSEGRLVARSYVRLAVLEPRP